MKNTEIEPEEEWDALDALAGLVDGRRSGPRSQRHCGGCEMCETRVMLPTVARSHYSATCPKCGEEFTLNFPGDRDNDGVGDWLEKLDRHEERCFGGLGGAIWSRTGNVRHEMAEPTPEERARVEVLVHAPAPANMLLLSCGHHLYATKERRAAFAARNRRDISTFLPCPTCLKGYEEAAADVGADEGDPSEGEGEAEVGGPSYFWDAEEGEEYGLP